MALVTTKELLLDAQKNGYAVGAFNVENMEMVQAVVSAAEKTHSPVILQTTPSTVKYADCNYFYANVRTAAERAHVPVVMHLDHGNSFELAMQAMRAGYTSIMIDGSHYTFDENVELTKRVVSACHPNLIPVEAELGKVGGKEDDLDGGEGDPYTNPQEAARFVELTQVDNYITNATPFGYTQINHQLVPEKNNAMIVNDIFKSYLSGMSINEIAEHLNTIYPKENSKWNPRTIHAILRNEKYIGDSLYQKTYTTDSLPLKRYLNTGQRSKYYAMETHEGIISKTDYEKVQNLLAKKSITGEIDRTCVFSKKIYCSICGAICSRKGPPTQGFVWCCRTHLQSKALCLLKSIREDELQQAFLSIYNRLQCNQKTILEPLVDDLLGLRHLQEQKYKKRLALGEDIQHLAKQKHNLARIHTLGYIEEPQFIERSAAIEQQIRERKQQLSRNDMSNTSEKILQKTRLIQKKLSSTPPLELFDESVFKELVKKVLISNTAIQFELINGMKLSESRAAT